VGMHPNTRFEAAHLATRCAHTLAHLEILKAFQETKEESNKFTSEKIELYSNQTEDEAH
jgi:hypothetical protein